MKLLLKLYSPEKIIPMIILLSFQLSVWSQERQKEVLLVDYFSYGNVNRNKAKMLRDAIIAGIQQTGRLHVIDVDMEPTLKLEESRRQSEKAMTDPLARNETMRLLGASYAMSGNIARMEGVRIRHEDGTSFYDGQISFTLKAINVNDGSVKASKTFTYAGLNSKTGKTAEEAVINTMDYIKISMTNFVNQHFKLITEIVAIETTNRKGAETVYIDCGEILGIIKGQLFDVYIEKEVAGKMIRQNIGALKVIEVQGDKLSLCKVTKGNDAIRKANEEQRKMIVVSGKKAFNLWETTKDVMK